MYLNLLVNKMVLEIRHTDSQTLSCLRLDFYGAQTLRSDFEELPYEGVPASEAERKMSAAPSICLLTPSEVITNSPVERWDN